MPKAQHDPIVRTLDYFETAPLDAAVAALSLAKIVVKRRQIEQNPPAPPAVSKARKSKGVSQPPKGSVPLPMEPGEYIPPPAGERLPPPAGSGGRRPVPMMAGAPSIDGSD